MKRNILLLLAFIIHFSFSTHLFSQEEKIIINYDVEEVISNGEKTFNITVNVDNRTGSVIYTLYKGGPSEKNKIDESKSIRKDSYLFENLSEGTYSIVVTESLKKGGYASIVLDNE